MGYRNIHINWLTHVKTGPQKIATGRVVSSPDPTYEREGLVTSGRYLGL